MRIHRLPILATMLLAVAACRPGVTEYSQTEALNQLSVDTVPYRLDLRFSPGSVRLAAGESERLRRFIAGGALGPNDQVTISTAGAPHLAEARAAAIEAELLRYGVVPGPLQLAGLAPDHAVVGVTRSVVTLPPCPNWSKASEADFTNATASNLGCANTTNFGRMVANPSDLVRGRPLGDADAATAVAAVTRYYTDKVQLPVAATLGPIAAAPSTTPAATGGPGQGAPGSQ